MPGRAHAPERVVSKELVRCRPHEEHIALACAQRPIARHQIAREPLL